MHRTRRTAARSFAAGSLLLMLAACGSSASTAPASPTTRAATAASSVAPTTAAGAATTSAAAPSASAASTATSAATSKAAAGGGKGCEDAAVAVDKVIGSSSDVTGIKVIGGCMVSVSTGLQPGAAGASVARDLCDKAADAAYAAGAKSVSIDSVLKHELAAGLKGSPCIGEP